MKILENIYILIAIPVISACIGWLTNKVAIKMLFHPRKPLGLGSFKFQGVLPRRQKDFAEIAAKTIGDHLLSQEDINKALQKLELGPYFKRMVDELLEKELAYETMGRSGIGKKVKEMIYRGVQKEIHKRIPNNISELNPEMITGLIEEIDIIGHIEEKLANYEIEKYEKMVMDLTRRELRSIEIMGGIIGFLIGLIQIAWLLWMNVV